MIGILSMSYRLSKLAVSRSLHTCSAKESFYSKQNFRKGFFEKSARVQIRSLVLLLLLEYLIMFAGTGFGGSAPVTTDIELQGGDLEQSITALSKKRYIKKIFLHQILIH